MKEGLADFLELWAMRACFWTAAMAGLLAIAHWSVYERLFLLYWP